MPFLTWAPPASRLTWLLSTGSEQEEMICRSPRNRSGAANNGRGSLDDRFWPKAATQRETLRSFPQHLQPDRENATWRKCVEKRLGSADCALETGRLAWESARKRLNRWLILRSREKRRQ